MGFRRQCTSHNSPWAQVRATHTEASTVWRRAQEISKRLYLIPHPCRLRPNSYGCNLLDLRNHSLGEVDLYLKTAYGSAAASGTDAVSQGHDECRHQLPAEIFCLRCLIPIAYHEYETGFLDACPSWRGLCILVDSSNQNRRFDFSLSWLRTSEKQVLQRHFQA